MKESVVNMPAHAWNGDSAPPTVQDVYDFIDRELKTLKTKLITKIEKQFFGGIEPIQFLLHIEEIFKSKHRMKRVKNLIPKISGWTELELFTRTCHEVRRPGGVRDAGFTKDIQVCHIEAKIIFHFRMRYPFLAYIIMVSIHGVSVIFDLV